jgi:flagellar assembly protein FliH
MPKAPVLKATEAGSCNVTPMDRDALPDFPAAQFRMADDLDLMDPEMLRETILAEARMEAERKIREAYDEAYQRGLDNGEEVFRESVAQAAQALENAALQILDARKAFLDALEPQVVELATLIAERVIDREVRTDPEIIVNTVRRALAQIADRQTLRLRVHPSDYEALRARQITLLEEFSGVEAIEIAPDDAVTPGGCIAESRLMQVDARMETLLGNVLETLTE